MIVPDSAPRRVVLLGATGSIGESTLRVIAAHPRQLELVAVAAQSRGAALADICRRFPSVRHAALFDESALGRHRGEFPDGVSLHGGLSGLETLATLPDADIVLVAVVGTTGLRPTLAALAQRKDVALASKEVLVMAGRFVMEAVRAAGVRLLPVDSEHNAVFQCLAGHPSSTVRRVVLTASGGAFRDLPLDRLREVTPADALRHPNWSMGPKVTVDSATMANKGLELIEARWLFGLRPAQCDTVLHPQSLVHALVEFTDGAMLSHLCPASMTFPIQHALLHPARSACPAEAGLELDRPLALDFRPVDPARYPLLGLARSALEAGGVAPAVFNAANEVAVDAFLSGRIPFLAMPRVVGHVLERLPATEPASLDEVLLADAHARRLAASQL